MKVAELPSAASQVAWQQHSEHPPAQHKLCRVATCCCHFGAEFSRALGGGGIGQLHPFLPYELGIVPFRRRLAVVPCRAPQLMGSEDVMVKMSLFFLCCTRSKIVKPAPCKPSPSFMELRKIVYKPNKAVIGSKVNRCFRARARNPTELESKNLDWGVRSSFTASE